MDFDLDDPLGDLLSDGSNDSFFGASKNKSQAKKAQAPSSTKAKSMVSDLFGIENETTGKPIETAPKPSIDLNASKPPIQRSDSDKTTNMDPIFNEKKSPTNLRQSIKRSTPEKNLQKTVSTDIQNKIGNVQSKSSRRDTQFDDSDDFLNELGFDPKNPKGGAKKSNILDDILNFGKSESNARTGTGTGTGTQASIPKPTTNDTERKASKSSDVNPAVNRYSPSSRRPRNLPRSGSGGSDTDPMGLFSTSTSQIQEVKKDEPSRPKLSKKPTVDWLGLDADTAVQAGEIAPTTSEETTIKANYQKPEESVGKITSSTPFVNAQTNIATPPIVTHPISIPNMALSNAENMSANLTMINMTTFENAKAMQSLQQQEAQLRIAAQMKQQESILYDMQTKQQTLIKQQENQFNDLLRRQIDRQNQLERQIQQQQDQINSYISVLMNQSNIGFLSTGKTTISDNDDKPEIQKNEEDISRHNFIELESDVKRLELEKLRLEDILQSVQSSHEQELELLHLSHKKQISLLEESLESLEKRLREEIKSTENYHLNKITSLQTDIQDHQHKYEENIKKLIEEYEKQIEKLRYNYENDLESLKNDQRLTIENIRQAKLYEFSAMQESGSYLNTLKIASDQLEDATGNLKSMRTNITSTIERIHDEREAKLNAMEQRLNDQQKNIEKNMEKTEEERSRLIELVKSLEIKLNSVEQSSTEEQWNIRQKTATLEAEKISFEREKTFTREKFATEEKKIEELKEKQFEEHKHLMNLLDAQREQVLIEKAKLETMERLKRAPSSSTKYQSELDAAIKIAQDAARSADIERENLIEQKRKYEQKKRELMERENKLQIQQSELELRISQAKDQKQVAEHATETCKTLERKLLAKMQSIQESYMELTEREAKLSQAKMELGKERMELQHLRQQLHQSKCSLCRIGVKNTEISDFDPLNDISTNDKPLFSSNSFGGLQQRLSNVEAMIDDVIINDPQSHKSFHNFHINGEENFANAHSISKSVIDPF